MVQVRILDHEYRIRSDEEDKVRLIADYLNEQLEKIQAGAPVLNRTDLLIMTAFKMVSDLFEARDELGRIKNEVENRAAVLSARIDENINLDRNPFDA